MWYRYLQIPAYCPRCDPAAPGQLFMAGAEATIRYGPHGPHPDWTENDRIWCTADDDHVWPRGEWNLLIKVLETTGQASA